MSDKRTTLLPMNSGNTKHTNESYQAEPLPNRRGAALQLDEFNLFVGRALVFLGIVGNIIEIGTSTRAIMIRFLDNPGVDNPGFWPKFGISLFIALVFQAAMWTVVVNLNDSWINIFEGHPEKAFVTKGEVNLHTLILFLFEWGGAAINAICDVIFFGNITGDGFLISIGTAALLLSSILMWPLGWKITRNAKRRIKATQLAAKMRASQLESQRAHGAFSVTPVVDGTTSKGLVRYENR